MLFPSRRRHLAPLPALCVVLTAGVLALAGCSDGGSGESAASSTTSASPSVSKTVVSDLSGITVTEPAAGATGQDAVPKVTVPPGTAVASTVSQVTSPGTGAPVTTGSVVSVDFVGVNATSGEQFGASSWAGSPSSFVLGDGVIPGFTKALEGVATGSTVLVAVAPVDGYGPQGGLEQAGIATDDTLVYLIKVDSVAPGWASGEKVDAPLPAGVTSVTVDEQTHAPTVTVDSSATPPTGLVSQTLVKGAGAVVQEGQTLTMQYTGVTWSTGKVFDSSWTKGTPFDFTLGGGQVIKGWDQGLQGVTVGSQVLLVIPPDLGYGSTAQGEDIPANSTLVFVVDVLAAQ